MKGFTRIVVLESPYAGDVGRNTRYIRAAMRDAFERGELPIASHALYTLPGVLDDTNPEEREKGIDAGFTVARQLLRGWLAEEGRYLYALPVVRVILTDLDKGKMSSGMRQGVIHASSIHMPIEFREIGWLDWENAPEREDGEI